MEALPPISPVVIEGMILASLVQWKASSQFTAGEGMILVSLVQWKLGLQPLSIRSDEHIQFILLVILHLYLTLNLK